MKKKLLFLVLFSLALFSTVFGVTGTGSAAIAPVSVTITQRVSAFQLTFTAGSVDFASGRVDVTIPTGWPAPVTYTGDGHVAASVYRGTIGTVTISGQKVIIPVTTLTRLSGKIYLNYSGVTVSNTAGTYSFVVASSSSTTTTASILTQPKVIVAAPTATPVPTSTPYPYCQGSASIYPISVTTTQRVDVMYLTFSAGTNDWASGQIDMTVPTGWPAPVTYTGDGQVSIRVYHGVTGTTTISGQKVTIPITSLAKNWGRVYVYYSGVNVTNTAGTYTWVFAGDRVGTTTKFIQSPPKSIVSAPTATHTPTATATSQPTATPEHGKIRTITTGEVVSASKCYIDYIVVDWMANTYGPYISVHDCSLTADVSAANFKFKVVPTANTPLPHKFDVKGIFNIGMTWYTSVTYASAANNTQNAQCDPTKMK